MCSHMGVVQVLAMYTYLPWLSEKLYLPKLSAVLQGPLLLREALPEVSVLVKEHGQLPDCHDECKHDSV